MGREREQLPAQHRVHVLRSVTLRIKSVTPGSPGAPYRGNQRSRLEIVPPSPSPSPSPASPTSRISLVTPARAASPAPEPRLAEEHPASPRAWAESVVGRRHQSLDHPPPPPRAAVARRPPSASFLHQRGDLLVPFLRELDYHAQPPRVSTAYRSCALLNRVPWSTQDPGEIKRRWRDGDGTDASRAGRARRTPRAHRRC